MAAEKYKVRMLCNLGWLDMEKYNLPAALEDEVIEVDERQMNVLVGILKCAVPAEGNAPAHMHMVRQSHATELEGAVDRQAQMASELEDKMQQRAETKAAERRRAAAEDKFEAARHESAADKPKK